MTNLMPDPALEALNWERRIADLRAENERLKAAVTEIGVAHIQAQAEVARENFAAFQEQRALKAEAEVERLRAALEAVGPRLEAHHRAMPAGDLVPCVVCGDADDDGAE
jgi:hypothetical protein